MGEFDRGFVSEAKWIDFVELVTSKKTKTWRVVSKEGGRELGEVKFFPSWRKYCFFPTISTVFEEDCLRDIAEFIEIQTAEWRAGLKAERSRPS